MPREYAANDGDAITKRIKELRQAQIDADRCMCVRSDDGKTTLKMSECPVHKPKPSPPQYSGDYC